jgi:ParB/RepB/Spo0J family partition protein
VSAFATAIDDPAAIQRPPIDGAVTLPIELVQASPTNPRKHFDLAKLEELAASIKKSGLLQPILVRPRDGARRGDALYEIVAGERRWRASRLGGELFINAIVRPMNDYDVVELQMVENLQRADLSPLEEADGYHQLLQRNDKFMGLKVEDLCARIGKSRSHVFQRLKLRALGEAGRMALEAGELSASVALLVARLPTEADQKRATEHLVQGWGGEPMSYRNAQAWIEREFMLRLSAAKFKITDATLVPTAGSCRECPKRTGANPDLFSDVEHADTCTDPACFHAKADAHAARLKAEAEARGTAVISGAEAKKAMPYAHGTPKGYFKLDEPQYQVSDKPLRKLLGKDGPDVIAFENPHTKEIIEVVREEDALKALKAKGLIKSASKMPTTSASQREADAARKLENAWRYEVSRELMVRTGHAAGSPEYCDLAIRHAALALYKELGNDQTEQLEKLMGWEHIGSAWQDSKNRERARQRIVDLSNADLISYFTAAAVCTELKAGSYEIVKGKAPPTRHLAVLATAAGVDCDGIRADLKAQAVAKANPKGAGKKAGASPAPAALTPERALATAVKKAARKVGAKVKAAPAAQLSAAAADPFRED